MKRPFPLFALLTLCALALPASALPGPTSASFAKGAKLTVAGYTGSSPLAGFPVLVRIAENSPSGFSYADLHSPTDGDDIAFVGMDGNGLPYEIDTWNPSGTSLVWVRLPTMTNGTEFVMCWGSDSSGKAVCNANPWSDYTGVWHMNETPAGVTTIHDSTANGLDGTTVSSSDTKSDGMVGRARFITSNTTNKSGKPYDSGVTVDMTDDPDKLAAVDAIIPEFTASFWVRPQNNAQWWYFITRKAADLNPGWGLQNGSDGNNSSFKVFRAYGSTETDSQCMNLTGVNGLVKGTWTKIDAVWMADKAFKLYVNGALAAEGTLVNQAANGDQTKLGIGGSMAPPPLDQNLNDNHKNGRGVYGDMDEVRLAAGAPTADRIAADYATVTDAAFLTAGTAEDYQANDNPQAGLQVSGVGYTNATVSVTVYSRGTGATSADVTVEVAASSDFASPVWTTTYTVDADNDARAFTPARLAAGTTYYARAVVSNNLDAVLTTPTATFATPVPGPVFTASVDMDRLAPDISLSFASAGWGSAVTRLTVQVSASADFSSIVLSKTYTVDLAAMPTNVADIALVGLPRSSPLYFRFIARNSAGYETTVERSASSALADGDNVWSGLSEDIADPDAYVFTGGLPASGNKLFFTSPAGSSPIIDRDTTLPSLFFTQGGMGIVNNQATYEIGANVQNRNGYHSCGYDFSGRGVLRFDVEKPLYLGTKGTNVIENPILFNRDNNQTVKIQASGGRLDLTGELMLPNNVSNTTMFVSGSDGEIHFGGSSSDFTGTFSLNGNITLSLDNPNAMTNVSRIYFGEWHGSYTYLKNNTGAPMTFPRCEKMNNATGWSSTRIIYTGAPFVFPVGALNWCPRSGGTLEADLLVKDLKVSKHGSNGDASLDKYGNGTLGVSGTTSWDANDCKHSIRLYGGCFWAQTDAGLPPSGEFYVPNDHAWQSTIGLSRDFYPTLDGSSTPRVFQSSKWATWGFTGFGGDRIVCWNADPTLNLTNTTGGAVSIPLGDAAHTNAVGKAYSDYYAYPIYFVFGNRSEFADGTILFLNPIRYELGGQEWDTKTIFESTNHVVAARLRGSLRLGSRNKTWTFTGRKFGGYLALEADNPDFTGKVSVAEKGNLLVNSNLVARSVAVQAGSGLGGTGTLGTEDGTTVQSGGALFGGEWNRGGVLSLGGKVTLESGSAVRAEVGASNDRIGLVKLAAGSTFKLTAPVYVDVDTDPRVSPVRGAARKILDWSEATFDAGAAPTRADFVARPESNSDIDTIYVFTRDDGLYINYITVRYPPATLMILR